MARVFLSARWRDLVIVSYAVDPRLLESRLASGLELDLFRGQAVCSLVGFRFAETRVLGRRWPGYRDFPEINLRFYVRETRGDRRGVVFVRELVRSRLVAGMARLVYNEPYVRARIDQRIEDDGIHRRVEYGFTHGGGSGRMVVQAHATACVPHEDSSEHWFKEHQWGYGVTRGGRGIVYEVRHPHWGCHEVRSWSVDVDWGRIYGREWSHMREARPLSVILAEGSEIKVFAARALNQPRMEMSGLGCVRVEEELWPS